MVLSYEDRFDNNKRKKIFATVILSFLLGISKFSCATQPSKDDMLINSAWNCNPAGVKQALRAKANPKTETSNGWTALMGLARCGDNGNILDAVAHLISRGASADAIGYFEGNVYSACDIALLFGNTKVADTLLKAGAPCRLKN